MRIWIDILTPKQILFLTPLAKLFKERNHEVYTTTRNYREVTELSQLKNLDMDFVGEHGGGSLYYKLQNSARRVAKLAQLIYKKKIECVVSFSSVEAARVAFGLSIPHICISDSPHAEAASKLTVPLSKLLFTPWVVPKKAWTCYGIKYNHVIQYKALDPYVWLKSFNPDKRFKDKIGLTNEAPVITIRPPEEYAAYLLNSADKSITIKIVDGLLKTSFDCQIVILPRYHAQVSYFKRFFKQQVKVIDHSVDGADLLASSDFFIGAGGTMTAEAVLLGTPTISCFPSYPTYVDQYLTNRGFIKHTLKPKIVLKHIKYYVPHEEHVRIFRQRNSLLKKEMNDPLPIIASIVEKLS